MYGKRKRNGVGDKDRYVPFKGSVPIVRDGSLEYSNSIVENIGTQVKDSDFTLIKHKDVAHSKNVKTF